MSKLSIACIALEGRKVLIALRNPTGQMGGRWEFPGGKVENGESEREAVVREFAEEFGIQVSVGEQLASAEFEHNGETVQLHAYRITVPHDGTAKPYVLSEHTAYKWVDIEEIPTEPESFVDSDLRIYPSVKAYVLRQDEAV